jgi:hypothetical protein
LNITLLYNIDSDFTFECISEVLSMSSWLNFMPDSRHSDLDSMQMSFAALKALNHEHYQLSANEFYSIKSPYHEHY